MISLEQNIELEKIKICNRYRQQIEESMVLIYMRTHNDVSYEKARSHIAQTLEDDICYQFFHHIIDHLID
jgi:hypothetical protein